MSDYRDLVITDLADSEALLRERVASLESDCTGYRLLAQEAIHALARVTRERDQARRELRYLRHQHRQDAHDRDVPKDAAA
jgi:hypothetical protein